MSATERLFHDAQARERAHAFQRDPARLLFGDEEYLDHETWIRPAFDVLGEVEARRVLDFGCGHGMASVVLARRGAQVIGFDLSPGYVAEADARARANRVCCDFVVADGHHLPFADASFDRVWGSAILHHLNLEQAARELRRVLRPGGVAVFCEPWGDNPLLSLARRYLPYPAKDRTPDERPLRRRDLAILRRVFPNCQVRGFQFLSMVRRVIRTGWLTQGLERCDARLLRTFPILERFCRYVVLTLRL